MILTRWAETLVQSLTASGVDNFVVSPGSRSTPFIAAAARSSARVHSIVDERAAAFFALGQARASGRPSVVVTTSGTAGAHCFPAVIEAAEARVPLIVLTADRPNEHQGCRSPQTIDQLHLYGRHARAFFELGTPDEAALGSLPRIASQAVARSMFPDPGPVHVNAKARKPLEPVGVARLDAKPPVVSLPRLVPSEETVRRIADRIRSARRGVIACGPAGLDALSPAMAALLSRATGFPILPEATSNLRFCSVDATRLDAFDLLLPAIDPDLVIAFGSPMTSARFHRFAEVKAQSQIVVTPNAFADPSNSAAEVVIAHPDELALRLAARLEHRSHSSTVRLIDANARAWAAIARIVERSRFSEAHVARTVVDALRDGDTLVVSNSLPIRHLDAYCPARSVSARVLSQRGANGIDGMIAGAAGAASIEGHVFLLVGDVAFLHDIGGLALAKGRPMTIVVVDNGGGRIFEQLPVARADVPMELFLTPPGIDFEAASRTFGLEYARVESSGALASALAEKRAVIHAKVAEHEGEAMRREIEAISEEVSSWL